MTFDTAFRKSDDIRKMLLGLAGVEALREVLTDREISYDVVRDNGPVETTIRVENLRSDLVITRASGVGVGLERSERRVRSGRPPQHLPALWCTALRCQPHAAFIRRKRLAAADLAA